MVAYKERSFVDYIQDLRIRVTRIAILVGIVTVFCMTFSISIFNFNGYKIPFPRPDTFNNIAIQVMLTMKVNLLPQNVNLIQLTPQGPFFTQIYVSAMLGIMLVMPVIVKELIGFISPGLYRHERAIVKKFTASAVGLFATGCLFSYFMVIPYILKLPIQIWTSHWCQYVLRHRGICPICNAVSDCLWAFISTSNYNVGNYRIWNCPIYILET